MERFYGLLLLAWPRGFRARFGPEMTVSFRTELDSVRVRGAFEIALFLGRTTVWMVLAGVEERLGIRGTLRRGGGMRMSEFGRDLRVAVRGLVREPGFALAAMVALGLGIGLTTSAFSIVWGTLLRGLPFEDAEQLVHFERADEESISLAVTPHDFVEWRAQQRSFVDLGAYSEALVTLEIDGDFPERVEGARIQATVFDLLGVRPVLGRTFDEADDVPAAERVVVLSHARWQRRFHGSPEVLGRAVRLNGEAFLVVGVMPPGFQFPLAEQFWVPLRLNLAEVERGEGRLDALGRLRDGVTLDQARTEFDVISRNLAEANPGTNTGIRARLNAYVDEYVDEEFNGVIMALLFAAALVLIVACLNVANLMLVRGTRRARELALRVSLGAGRDRIVQQMMAEASALAAGGAILGVGLAWVAVSWFAGTGSRPGTFELAHGSSVPFWWDIRLDVVPLTFVLICTLGTVLIAALVPAIQALRADPNLLLREERRGGTARTGLFSRGVVTAEIAVATGVLSVAGLMGKSVLRLAAVGEGVESEGVTTARIALPDARLGADESTFPTVESRLQFWEEMVSRLASEPGIRGAAATSAVPFERSARTSFGIPGVDGEQPQAGLAAVGRDFFSILGVTPLVGRLFDTGDGPGGAPAVVVNQSFSERWLGAAAVGSRIEIAGPDGLPQLAEVVGVVPDLWMQGLRDDVPEGIYLPLTQSAGTNRTDIFDRRELRYLSVMVRAESGTSAAEAIRKIAAELAPGVPIYSVATMESILERAGGQYRLYGAFYMVFGAAALFMVLLGLYGLIACSVGQRTREVGIRIALGAARRSVLAMIIRSAMVQVAFGLVGGAVVALWLRRTVQLVLYQVEPDDASVLVGVLLLLLATTALAATLPARRAAAVDPMDAIRSD